MTCNPVKKTVQRKVLRLSCKNPSLQLQLGDTQHRPNACSRHRQQLKTLQSFNNSMITTGEHPTKATR
jgi:hypothetical protein